MPSTLKPGAVLFAKDLKRIAEFYRKLLSLSVLQAEQDFVVLESEVFQLVIHAIPEHIVGSINIMNPPIIRQETPVKLSFPVANIAKTRAIASLLCGQVNPSQSEWETNSTRICDGFDPEGNVFQLRQAVSLP